MFHNVYFWLKADTTSEQRSMFESELIKLKEIPYLVHGFVGKPAPTEERPVTDHSFDYSLTLHFKNLEDHDHYQTKCERHLHFVEVCRPLFDRVVVYDTSPIH
ncbi:Dabb family protein [Phragmitibacter flavus]|uniref:Dabb family protein n=1 Tax=Phragmitibacter flavus TaxID=2576071 RepID=A0A5R8KEG7_9BACT|nr:Dabb family protein [Phragmitibacter flavus]TLD70702.1 Dabb family protein [Phragmitibacter flavus]